MTDILMTTYNGARYVEAQLDSLFAQSNSDFRLFIRDDESSDRTVAILTKWQKLYPEQIRIISDQPHTGAPGANFLSLLNSAHSEYIMYCDQDDVWMPDKVEKTLAAMHRAETEHPGTPILVHTDLAVTDERLNSISPSFMRYQNLEPSYKSLPQLTAQNNVTGCTVMINGCLRDLIRTPPQPVLHDWWTALTAAAFGRIVYVGTPTVYYRQHSANTIGAQNAHSFSRLLNRVKQIDAVREALMRTYQTANIFAATYDDLLDTGQKLFLAQYGSLADSNCFTRLSVLKQHGAFKKGILRAAAQIIAG